MTRPIIIRDEHIRSRVIETIRRLNADKAWAVTIEPHKKKRSLSQNALLHKWLQIIADETGNSIDAVKDAYREMFLGKVAIRLGDEERLVGRSTATLDTKEMSEFMDRIYAHATGELGILLPVPEQAHAA